MLFYFTKPYQQIFPQTVVITVVRFCTSWATTQEDIDALAAVL